ncbi:DivIVA domain-containing protein [Arthrobacter zhangbolii]|uniref:DivIVA domain-containing protein n=1 Tax=Arthrobacter zhangbolii TaxID=2886936 RepID=UPI003C2C4AAA
MAQESSDDGGSVILWWALGIALLIYFVFSLVKKSKATADKQPVGQKAAQGNSAMTAEAVVAQRFQPTKFREGYDQDEVDRFLDTVVGELRRLQEENELLQRHIINPLSQPVFTANPGMSADQVINQKFSPTKFREGYDQDEVDDFLQKIIAGLRQWAAENDQLRARISGNVIP